MMKNAPIITDVRSAETKGLPRIASGEQIIPPTAIRLQCMIDDILRRGEYPGGIGSDPLGITRGDRRRKDESR
ncbi:MAG: hypothetical protein JWQ98_1130 [Chlorobi bacterium]|nr:hypothetical protein [Chlorobiota bacterium]